MFCYEGHGFSADVGFSFAFRVYAGTARPVLGLVFLDYTVFYMGMSYCRNSSAGREDVYRAEVCSFSSNGYRRLGCQFTSV